MCFFSSSSSGHFTNLGSLFRFLIMVLYWGSLFGFLIQVPYLGSLFRFLIWVPYSGSLFRFLIWVSYSGSISGYLFRFLLCIPYLGSSGLLKKSVCGFCLSSDLFSSSWRLKGFSVLLSLLF